MTGIPDHDEAIRIESTINKLIRNNEKQNIMNSSFEKLNKRSRNYESRLTN